MSLTEKGAKAIVDRVLAEVARLKGADATVSVTGTRGGHTRFALGGVTTSGDVERQGVGVTVAFGKRVAYADTNQADDASIRDVVARAARLARLVPESPEQMPPLGPQTYVAVKGAHDAATAAADAAARGKAPAAAIAQAKDAKVQVAGFIEHVAASSTLATSAGLRAHHEATGCAYSLTARTADGTGSGWAGGVSNRLGDLDVDALARTAIDKAVRSASPKKLAAGKYTVVLEPAAVASLLGFLTGSLDAREADEGRSFFARKGGGTRVGETLFPTTITLRSDPAEVAVDGAPFDGEGLPSAPVRWIDKGVLTALRYTRYWAAQQHATARAWPTGWVLDGGAATRDELVKGVDRGVLITRLYYLRMVDPQAILATGLTRDGVFLIEKGEIVGPVNNFRFNHSPVTMLAKCDALGASVPAPSDEGQAMRVPALRTHEFDLASVSEAV